MNWKYIQKLVTTFRSLWEKFIQNRPVYKKLKEEHKQATVALDKACQKFDELQVKHERTKARLTETCCNLSTLQAKHDEITTNLTKTQHDLKKLHEKHDRTNTNFNKLKEEHKQATVALDKACQKFDELQVKHERTKARLTETCCNLSTLQAKHDEITTNLTKTQHDLKKLHEKHDRTNTNFSKLKEEHKQATATLDETRDNYSTLQEKHDQTIVDLSEAHKRLIELDDLASKYELVSNLLTPQSCENEEFEKFKKLFEADFMNFANEESSLAAEAFAVQRLQRLEKQLEEVVAFPHTFTKKSIAIGGGFSSGKSEFVNSLITGSVKLPVGLNPTTAIPSFVIYSSEVSIKGVSRNGATVGIEPEFYTRLSRDFIKKIKNFMPYMTVEVPLDKELFENICLIDTPGYDPAGESEDRITATDFLKDRDALIWMIPAKTGTIPQEDLEFIDDLELNGIPFYVVLSKADLHPESELDGILDEVKETLDEEDIEYVGISVYSATSGKEYLYDKMCLYKFFDIQNETVENMRTELRKEIEKVFLMYEKAIYKDEKTADWLVKKLSSLSFDISDISSNLGSDIDSDNIDGLTEKIDKIKESQNKDFTEIKKKLRQVKENMLKAVDNIFWSLRSQGVEVTPRPQPDHRSRQKSSRQSKKNSEKPPFTNPQPPPVQEDC